jgi:2-oxoglutarate ferredoxin oxidoreductase subunit delta
MANRITIDSELCKGCGLCVDVCPKKSIVISKASNKSGYFPAEFCQNGCTACAACAVMCPEAAIEVTKDADEPTGTKKKSGKGN